MAYTRLLRAYYRREKPITEDEKYRLARAVTKAQKVAVDSVLREFFFLEADGWHNRRADQEILTYQAQASTNRRIARERFVDESPTVLPTNTLPNQNQNQKKKQQGAGAPPDWVPLEAWTAYLEMRQKIRKPLTRVGAILAWGKLSEFQAQGHDPRAVLEQSIFNSWQGLFPLKPGTSSVRKVAL